MNQALWTYCVLSAPAAARLPLLDGVEAGADVEVVIGGDLAAVVSPVPLSDYAEDPLREHLNDIAWVERVARAHEDVLERALEQTAIVPLRMCTIFRSRGGVADLLREQRGELQACLQLLDGRAEWGLKLFVDRAALQLPTAGDGDAAPVQDGLAWIARKQRERDLRQTVDDVVTRFAVEAHERAVLIADASKLNRVQRPETHGRDEEMILNGAYLVSREREPELAAAIDGLRASWPDEGLTLQLTGPWPAYNFVSDGEAVAL